MSYKTLKVFGWGGRRRTLMGVDSGACALLSGIGLGAGLMYFLDRNNGKRRRTMVADAIASWASRGACAVEGAAGDARDRLSGVAHEVAKRVRRPQPPTNGDLADEVSGLQGNGGATRTWEGS